MSLAECTATSIRPSSSASSSSLTNTPREPISPNGRVRSRSPAVVTGRGANSSPGRRSRSTASSACVSASRLPLEPTRRSTAALLVAGLLQPHDRLVQELVHDLARHRLDGTPLGVRQVGQPGARLRQLGATLDEVPGRHLADLAGADDEDPSAGEVSEHLRGEGRRRGRDGGRAFADRGFGADALAGMQRLPEEPVEERPDRAALICRADLTLDLSFARNQRVEPGGDAKEMGSRRLLLEAEEVRLELRPRDTAEIGKLGGRPLAGGVRVRRRQVELRPVARREADGLAAPSPPPGECRLAVRVERDPLADLHGRETMRGSDEQQLHATWAKRSPSWRTMTAATPPRARAAASSRRPARTRR